MHLSSFPTKSLQFNREYDAEELWDGCTFSCLCKGLTSRVAPTHTPFFFFFFYGTYDSCLFWLLKTLFLVEISQNTITESRPISIFLKTVNWSFGDLMTSTWEKKKCKGKERQSFIISTSNNIKLETLFWLDRTFTFSWDMFINDLFIVSTIL